MLRRTSARLASLLALGLLLSACSSMMLSGGGGSVGVGGSSGGVSAGGSSGSKPGASEETSDSDISAEIKNRYRREPQIDVFDVNIRTVDGTVTLSGRVDSYEARDQAYRLARQTEGVRAVVNQIRVMDRSR
ncbi:MAG: BON domain-containing protein [Pseudomonadota bacterium]